VPAPIEAKNAVCVALLLSIIIIIKMIVIDQRWMDVPIYRRKQSNYNRCTHVPFVKTEELKQGLNYPVKG